MMRVTIQVDGTPTPTHTSVHVETAPGEAHISLRTHHRPRPTLADHYAEYYAYLSKTTDNAVREPARTQVRPPSLMYTRIVAALKALGGSATASQIVNKMREMGYTTRAKNPRDAIARYLRRGRFIRGEMLVSGERVWRLPQDEQT